MPRKAVKKNPACGRRLKELLIENGMSQIELSERLHCDAQHISNIVCGRRNLTFETALRITGEIFPTVRLEWLLCMDDFKTQEEKDAYSRKKYEERCELTAFYDKVFRCFIDSIEDLAGYGIHSQGTDILTGDYVVVSDANGKKVGVIQSGAFYRLRHEIENFAAYSLNLLIKNEMWALPKSEREDGDNG